jgi:hypothetical protein
MLHFPDPWLTTVISLLNFASPKCNFLIAASNKTVYEDLSEERVNILMDPFMRF